MSRFLWPELTGRCRQRLAAGLVLLSLGLSYGAWSAARLRSGEPGAGFDQPIVTAAARLVRPPDIARAFNPRNDRELELFAVVVSRQDALFGMTLLVLRLIVTGTVSGLGLVLLTAGSTEWELRSERASATSTASS